MVATGSAIVHGARGYLEGMSRIRSAFVMSSLEQYVALIVNLAMMAVLARLLTPSEIGVAVVGMGISAVIFSLREFATPEFLIQRQKITEQDARTAATIIMGFGFALAAGLYLAAEPLSRFYGQPGLKQFLTIMLIAGLIETSALPAITLFRREMSFGALARIKTAASVLTALSTVMLASLGSGYMSYAWGLLIGATATRVLVSAAARSSGQFRPSFTGWRDVLSFGLYRGATSTVEKIYETLPQMLLGHFMPMSAVGYYNRANAICGIPDRLLLSPLFAIAFPALAAQVREGGDVKAAYLRLLGFITAAYWPALAFIALTADILVHIILGSKWDEVILLVRLLALAGLFWFPVIPTNPLLLAMGGNRDAFLASIVSRGVAAAILCSASLYGIVAMAASQFIALPFQMLVALFYARKHVMFTWRELVQAIGPSVWITISAMAGPLTLTLLDGNSEFTLVEFGGASVTAAIGWLAGLYWTRHPLLAELADPLRPIWPSLLPSRRSASAAE